MAEKRKHAHAGGTVPLRRTAETAPEVPAFSDPVFYLEGFAEGEKS